MKGNRFLSIVAGLIIGGFLGSWIYGMEACYLAYAPFWELAGTSAPVPDDLRNALLIQCFKFGIIPGLAVGFIAGGTFPFLIPRGHMSKSIGCFLALFLAPVVWITQWHNLQFMGAGNKTIAVFLTVMVFLFIIPIGGFIGEYVERLREIGLHGQKGEGS